VIDGSPNAYAPPFLGDDAGDCAPASNSYGLSSDISREVELKLDRCSDSPLC
jgi:hypothetical protein